MPRPTLSTGSRVTVACAGGKLATVLAVLETEAHLTLVSEAA